MQKINYDINQAVLSRHANTPEFAEQIYRLAASMINSHYGKSIWYQKDLTEALLSSAVTGAYAAIRRHVLDSPGHYYETHDSDELLDNLIPHKVNKSALNVLYRASKTNIQ